MAVVHDSQAIRNFIDFGLLLIDRLGQFRDLEGDSIPDEEICDIQLQLLEAESALQDEVAQLDVEAVGVALAAALSVVRDLKIRFTFFTQKLHDAHQERDFKGTLDSIWPRANLDELNGRLATIRAALMYAVPDGYIPPSEMLIKE